MRIGELTRSDDGVLGFFVNDDYSRFRLVDKAIAATAAEAGRSRGQLGVYDTSSGMPPSSAIDHPYIAGTDDADTLQLHIGQTVTLTILMHPAGKATLTSGVLPRKALALARDWVGPGLAAIAPSLRTGPVLVETDLATEGQVRLPKVSVFGKDQNFLWRDTPATWRTDAILAATQTALLPDNPAELREGLDPRGADKSRGRRRMSRYAWPAARREEKSDDPAGRGDLMQRVRVEFDAEGARVAARTGSARPASARGLRAPASGRAHLWQPLGPDTVIAGQAIGAPRIAGRVNMLAVHPDGNRVYAASANGGAWYSSDAGLHWRSLGGMAATPGVGDVTRPAQRNACGSIAVVWGATEASDLVYVGTGETTHSRDAQPGHSLGGIGILRGEHPATVAGPTRGCARRGICSGRASAASPCSPAARKWWPPPPPACSSARSAPASISTGHAWPARRSAR